MSLEDDLRTYLCGQSTITAIIGTNPQRMYGTVLSQGAVLPAITYQTISAKHGDVLLSAAGFCWTRIQLNCWAETSTGTRTLAEAIRQLLHGYHGTMGSTVVQAVLLDNENDAYEPPVDAKALGAFCRMVDYRFRYTESIPNL